MSHNSLTNTQIQQTEIAISKEQMYRYKFDKRHEKILKIVVKSGIRISKQMYQKKQRIISLQITIINI